MKFTENGEFARAQILFCIILQKYRQLFATNLLLNAWIFGWHTAWLKTSFWKIYFKRAFPMERITFLISSYLAFPLWKEKMEPKYPIQELKMLKKTKWNLEIWRNNTDKKNRNWKWIYLSQVWSFFFWNFRICSIRLKIFSTFQTSQYDISIFTKEKTNKI